MTAKINTSVNVGYFICSYCTKTKPPGKRFKVYATEAGKLEMRLHVEYCKK